MSQHIFLAILLLGFFFLSVDCARVFDFSLARNTVNLALSAYCGVDRVNLNWNCYWCKFIPDFKFVGSWHDDDKNIFGFAGYHNNVIYASWRGTLPLNIVNWLGNFNMIPVSFPETPNAQVHSGFLDNYQAVQDQARNILIAAKNQCPQCERVVVTGHSLGGALAILNSIEISNWINIPSSSITVLSFSAPRVGNREFVDHFEKFVYDSWNVVNDCDLVPHVPARALGYREISSEQWWDDEDWHTCDKRENPSCSSSFCLLYNVLDHAITLEKNVPDGIMHGCLIYNT